jgi:hypothetical protein
MTNKPDQNLIGFQCDVDLHDDEEALETQAVLSKYLQEH